MICACCRKALVDEASFCPYCGTAVEGGLEFDDFEYEAFISYRHYARDADAAVKLQASLENFRIPKSLRKRKGRSRLGKLFRDEDELATSASLTAEIKAALKRSRYLIVMCSPESRDSAWVAQEVELFASYHGRDKILLALCAGEPAESFPLLLQTRLAKGRDGTVRLVDEEPLAADLRNLSRRKLGKEKLRLAAPLIGCSYDELKQRFRARRLRFMSVAACSVASASIAFGSFSLYQQMQIQHNYRLMQVGESELLAAEADSLLASGDRMQAIQVAMAALPGENAGGDRPFVPAAQLALESALGVYPSESLWRCVYSNANVAPNRAISAFSVDGLVATLRQDGEVEVRELESGRPVSTCAAGKVLGVASDSQSRSLLAQAQSSSDFGISFCGEKLVCFGGNRIACFDSANGELLWSTGIDGLVGNSVAVSADGAHIAALASDGDEALRIASVNPGDGSIRGYVEIDSSNSSLAHADDCLLVFSLDASKIALGVPGSICVLNLKNGHARHAKLGSSAVQSCSFVGDCVAVVSRDAALDQYGPATVEMFDSSLNLMWAKKEMRTQSQDVHGKRYASVANVYGSWSYGNDDAAEQVVALFDHSLELLDLDDGNVVYRITLATPFVACAIVGEGEDRRICAATSGGDVIMRSPTESSPNSGSANDEVLPGATAGDFKRIGDSLYYAFWASDADKHLVYRLTDGSPETARQSVLARSVSTSAGIVRAGNRLVVPTAASLELLDGEAYSPSAAVSLDELEHLDIDRGFDLSAGDAGRLYVFGRERRADGKESSNSVVYVLDAERGKVISHVLVENIDVSGVGELRGSSARDRAAGEPIAFAVYGGSRLAALSYDTGAWEATYVDRPSKIRRAWFAGTKVLVCERASDNASQSHAVCRVALLSAADGAEVTLPDLQDWEVEAENVRCISVSADGAKCVLPCPDGNLCMFDLANGEERWRTSDLSGKLQSVCVVGDGELVVCQDESGSCLLVGGDDGKVLAVSSGALPSITEYEYRRADNVLLARCAYEGRKGDVGTAVISLDKDSFGPVSCVFSAIDISDSGSSAVLFDEGARELRVARLYTLSELLDRARSTTQGNELDRAQRRTYHIDSG